MPCRDWDDNVRIVEKQVDRPETVRILCEACRIIEDAGRIGAMSQALYRWCQAHKKEDEARMAAEKKKLEKEAKKKAILAKLTDEEKKILGIK